MQPAAAAAVSAAVAVDAGLAPSLPVGTYRDEDLGAIGGAVGGNASHDFADVSVTPSYQVVTT